jgi:nucleoside-diphosphate-sugar epimerase
MKVALVGPTGVLGRTLVAMLLEHGHTVRALARSIQKARTLFHSDVEIVECNLLSPDVARRLPEMLEGCDAVAHIATAIPRDFNAPGAWDANTQLRTNGVKALLRASLAAGVERYLQQSITMAYPDCGDEWITEERPLDSSPGRAVVCGPVIAMETMVRDVPTEALRWCILRGGAFVGPGTFQELTVENLRAGREVVAGDGRNFVSLIHVEDMAAALVAALTQAPAGSVFNIVAEPLRNGDYLDRLAESIGAARPARAESAKRPPSWRCSSRAAQSALGWSPGRGLIV